MRPPATSTVAKRARRALLATALACLAASGYADDFHTLVGAGVGAVAGAAIGQSFGGHHGAILGAGAGGLVGASIASHSDSQRRYYPAPPGHTRSPYPATYYQQPALTWQAAPPQYRYTPPLTYYPAPVAIWQPPQPQPYDWRARHHHRHHHGHHAHHGHGWRDH